MNKYCYIIGDDSAGRSLVLNPPLASGASIAFDFQSYPSSLATLTDISVCPQPDYLVKRSIAYVLEARSDTRFPKVKQDADVILQKMIEEKCPISGRDKQNTVLEKPKDFVMGED